MCLVFLFSEVFCAPMCLSVTFYCLDGVSRFIVRVRTAKTLKRRKLKLEILT